MRRAVLIGGGIAALLAVLVGALAASRIADGFESRERDERSVLLGRPYRLVRGAAGSARELVGRLDRLGYRRVEGAPQLGEYSVSGERVAIHLRGFDAAGTSQPAGPVRVRFAGSRMSAVDPAPARLEPETLAVFQGPHLEEREILDVAQVPKHLVDAVLAAEDRRFFRHPGLDPAGIARALRANVEAGGISQGGSTLTQQLAKNLYFSDERTWARKAAEAYAALVLEWKYSKERILRAYLNEVYLGQRGAASVRGVGAAARHYFGKSASDLTLDESALLAGLIRAPGMYNPFQHPDRARERRDAVLGAMEQAGLLDPATRKAAERKPVTVRRPTGPSRTRRAPYVAALVSGELESEFGAGFWARGLRVHTTLEPAWQDAAEAAVRDGLARLERDYRSLKRRRGGEPLQAALVSIDLADASIVALVGGRDFGASQFNRVTSAKRQPGSLFKPLVYAAGLTRERGNRKRRSRSDDDIVLLDKRKRSAGTARASQVSHAGDFSEPSDELPELPLTAATILIDQPYEVLAGGRLWSPRNDDDEFRGPVTVQQALEQSLNVPTARAAAAIGLGPVAATAAALGIHSALPEVPSLALGSAEVTPLEIATAFSTLASSGVRREPFLVRATLDFEGRQVDSGRVDGLMGQREAQGIQAVPRETAELLTALLQGVLDHGTGRRARALGFSGTAAGKTGTSDDGRDLWFCGYTPRILTLVWVGFDDARATPLAGSRAALPIWVDYMRRIGADSLERFESSSRLAWADIDPLTGQLARNGCPEVRSAPFLPGTEPEVMCREHATFWQRWFGSR